MSSDRRSRRHWYTLSEAEKREAVVNMADFGHSHHVIASATGLSIEQIRAILAERETAQ